ncbi:enoyl-CoA hydratase [Mycobacterium intermedium]|uniref:Enoyl-CoA hydratase n=1 Tax=Mycobacterium intermedium TaxID=28445 RepID=A0A1E3SHA6_MYCIE|nr:enoyl-CoA hydratase family protein [Mycobacterium intermedium]MCV6963307.1 enoyl-CoA hydratase family protein [Mycobacterium intermedium]ODR01521.1 enoyl-CoA hydratase [Mycobacterium intermedium]OPE46875.1 enoyl-CoA hydratase [Mycobacterium intermedium]ORA96362.1 enoyl-CoA hydratase [Mycobacterium intermedium]
MDTLVEYAGPAETGGPVAKLTLNSPHNRNALSTTLVNQLHQGLRDAAADPAVRVVVLGHTGGTFCAGADLSESGNGDPRGDRERGEAGRSGSPPSAYELAAARAREMTALLRAIVESPMPVIGAINGHVRAGGFGLVGACDIVVAGPRSTFALTEARIGVAPAIISLTLLPKLSARAAARYYLTGETFGANEAAEIGLITLAADDVDAAVAGVVADVGRGSPQGLAASKALTTAAVLAGFDRDAERLTEESARLFVSDEAREGMLAFLQKRLPSWVANPAEQGK